MIVSHFLKGTWSRSVSIAVPNLVFSRVYCGSRIRKCLYFSSSGSMTLVYVSARMVAGIADTLLRQALRRIGILAPQPSSDFFAQRAVERLILLNEPRFLPLLKLIQSLIVKERNVF